MYDFFGVLPSRRPAPRAAHVPSVQPAGQPDDAAEQKAAEVPSKAPRTRRGAGLARKRARPVPSGDLSAMGHLLS
ncbi:hypothetical protein [Bordetella genomosp. 5]|uniref:Uncharacterized protein n=1 Tax=Bordetella genomosp. 5 TaxID=1395608 RepID=A0A261T9C1_9BORD|nr:hypothetical protein [Bordetella genomosp. 5]OZI45887.1 hypothetical protein CAL25_21965 [Bordetella genomosp. 5]